MRSVADDSVEHSRCSGFLLLEGKRKRSRGIISCYSPGNFQSTEVLEAGRGEASATALCRPCPPPEPHCSEPSDSLSWQRAEIQWESGVSKDTETRTIQTSHGSLAVTTLLNERTSRLSQRELPSPNPCPKPQLAWEPWCSDGDLGRVTCFALLPGDGAALHHARLGEHLEKERPRVSSAFPG